ncbi:MAG: pilin [Patescibacteria group bacterium]|nr:pilin [Patescibacteria group bacterium]
MSKRFIIIFIFLFLYIFIFANFTFATEGEKDLSIQLSSALGGTVSGLPEFIERIYTYMIAIAGGLATVMLMLGGFIYLTAAGDKSKIDKALNMIGNAVIGLFLVIGAYVILNTINPAMLKMEMPEIKTIARVNIEFAEKAAEAEKIGVDSTGAIGCVRPDEPIPIGVNASTWCEDFCDDTHLSFEVIPSREGTERHNCCRCETPRADVVVPRGRAGSERGCLLQVNISTIMCGNHIGTDGMCSLGTEEDGGRFSRCEWEPTECSSNADCERIGSVNCWDGKCYQRKLANGEACNDGSGGVPEACESGSCLYRSNPTMIPGQLWPPIPAYPSLVMDYYCAPSPENPDLIPLDGFCDSSGECLSGLCSVEPDTFKNRKECR